MEHYRVSWYSKSGEAKLVDRVRSTSKPDYRTPPGEWKSEEFDNRREAIEFYLDMCDQHDGTTLRKPTLERGVLSWETVL